MSAETRKIRPIISCVGGPSNALRACDMNFYPEFHRPFRIQTTSRTIVQAEVDSNCVIKSFDVISLYTITWNDEALKVQSEMLRLWRLYRYAQAEQKAIAHTYKGLSEKQHNHGSGTTMSWQRSGNGTATSTYIQTIEQIYPQGLVFVRIKSSVLERSSCKSFHIWTIS